MGHRYVPPSLLRSQFETLEEPGVDEQPGDRGDCTAMSPDKLSLTPGTAKENYGGAQPEEKRGFRPAGVAAALLIGNSKWLPRSNVGGHHSLPGAVPARAGGRVGAKAARIAPPDWPISIDDELGGYVG